MLWNTLIKANSKHFHIYNIQEWLANDQNSIRNPTLDKSALPSSTECDVSRSLWESKLSAFLNTSNGGYVTFISSGGGTILRALW
jgi:hypothetical protein